MASLKTLKGQIELMLANYPETRDSDITLMIRIWREYYPSRVLMLNGSYPCVLLENLYDLPREDNIKRIRAKIQNVDGLYLPNSWEVASKRGIEKEKWETFMGYQRTGNPNQKPLL